MNVEMIYRMAMQRHREALERAVWERRLRARPRARAGLTWRARRGLGALLIRLGQRLAACEPRRAEDAASI